jgi:2'-5' RNA ligase
VRLFVGVELDDAVRAEVAAAAERMRVGLRRVAPDFNARWIPPPNLHITVWFIGDVTDDLAGRIGAALAPRMIVPAFEASISGWGAFPSHGPPRVLWLGVTDPAAGLLALYRDVESRFGAQGLEPERRSYSAHLTAARVKDPGRTPGRAIRQALADTPVAAGPWRISALTLFRSRPGPEGSSYDTLLRVPLS